MEARLGMERLIRFFAKIFFLATLCFCLASSSWAQQEGPFQSQNDKSLTPEQEIALEEEQSLTREPKVATEEEEPATREHKIPSEKKKEYFTSGQKTLLLNAGAMAAVLVYGFSKWDYGKSSFNFKEEGWFERDSQSGGADKLGHFWSSYAMSHLYSYVYRKWGYTESEANLYGALSNLGFQTFMEVADGFSPSQGFSYEDMIMNIVGTGVAYAWGKAPYLSRKIDFRMEYKPEFSSRDFGFSTNYGRQRFLIALKADGFDFIKNPYLRYLEFHVGYYARGYKDYDEGGPDDRRRKIYVGLGFNVSRLVQKYVKTTVFDYIQIPYTSVTKTVASD
jgi:VanZ family protein